MSSPAGPVTPRFATLRRWWGVLADLARPVTDVVRGGADCVSGLGWTTLVLGVVALAAGWALGWDEFRIIRASLLLLHGLLLRLRSKQEY